MTATFIGERRRRHEDPRFLTGRGKYVADIALPEMLHAAILRSPHAHARIRSLDLGRARGHPGVTAALCAADLGEMGRVLPPGQYPGLRAKGFPVLAADKVRYVGEAVAV